MDESLRLELQLVGAVLAVVCVVASALNVRRKSRQISCLIAFLSFLLVCAGLLLANWIFAVLWGIAFIFDLITLAID